MNNLSDDGVNAFKLWLGEMLRNGEVSVTFSKKDGTERVMRCTTNVDMVPKKPVVENTEEENTEHKERKQNPDVKPVYDLEAKSWRSFRWDAIHRVEFENNKDAV